MLGYTIPVYILVVVWLSVFYFFYSGLPFLWSLIYYILAFLTVYSMFMGYSTVLVGMLLGLMILPITSSLAGVS